MIEATHPAPATRPATASTARLLSLGVLLVAVAATHAVARARTLTEIDSVNLAKALSDFDVTRHQPHPPGYPLLVGAAHAISAALDPIDAYLTLSAALALATVVVTALLAAELFGGRASVAAAAIVVATPLFLYYTSIVSVYMAEAFFMTLVVLLAARLARDADRRSAVALPIALGVGAGFRPSLLVFALPACAVGVVVGRPPWRPVLGGLGVGAAVTASWLAVTVVESGGITSYLSATRLYRDAAERTSALLGGAWVSNGVLTVSATALAVLPAAALVVLCARRRPTAGWRWWLLGSWLAPYVLFCLVVHLGKPGYLLAIVPAVAVAAAGLVGDSPRAQAAAAIVAGVGVAYFLFVPNVRLPERVESYRPFAFAPTADAIRVQDAQADALLDLAATCRRPQCTIVSTGSSERFWEHEPWGLEEWYAPDGVIRLREATGPDGPRRTAIWAGARPPDAVLDHASELEPVGSWRIFRSGEAATSRIVEGLRREGR